MHRLDVQKMNYPKKIHNLFTESENIAVKFYFIILASSEREYYANL